MCSVMLKMPNVNYCQSQIMAAYAVLSIWDFCRAHWVFNSDAKVLRIIGLNSFAF
jgi:hypothetical protein